jgi:hypothetical protein
MCRSDVYGTFIDQRGSKSVKPTFSEPTKQLYFKHGTRADAKKNVMS